MGTEISPPERRTSGESPQAPDCTQGHGNARNWPGDYLRIPRMADAVRGLFAYNDTDWLRAGFSARGPGQRMGVQHR